MGDITNKVDVVTRIRQAASKGNGLRFSADEVRDLAESMQSLGAVVAILNTQALKCEIPAEAVIDLVADCLCLPQASVSIFCPADKEQPWTLQTPLEPAFQGPSLLAVIDLHRNRCGKPPVSGMEVLLPGSLILEQIMQAASK